MALIELIQLERKLWINEIYSYQSQFFQKDYDIKDDVSREKFHYIISKENQLVQWIIDL